MESCSWTTLKKARQLLAIFMCPTGAFERGNLGKMGRHKEQKYTNPPDLALRDIYLFADLKKF